MAEYVEKPPAALTPESAVVRVEYFGDKKTLGYLELYKLPAEKGSDFSAKTENSRWFVKVLASAGEQVEQDLSERREWRASRRGDGSGTGWGSGSRRGAACGGAQSAGDSSPRR